MTFDASPPKDEAELLCRTRELAGRTLAELASHHTSSLPGDLRHAKGWLGQIIERQLGATAGSLAQPDFPHLHIELKTLPLNLRHYPKESTYVCTVPLDGTEALHWSQSWVCRKLKRILWIPYEADAAIELANRRIGTAILWSPNPQQELILKQDWEEIMELINTGNIDQISAKMGTYLQVRPKAANSKALRQTSDEHGDATLTLPRGFYLRTQFTAQILQQHYAEL